MSDVFEANFPSFFGIAAPTVFDGARVNGEMGIKPEEEEDDEPGKSGAAPSAGFAHPNDLVPSCER